MRKMATVQRIAEARNIEGADLIAAYRINGWWVVDGIDKYVEGDTVVYCEIDSWIPHDLAPFLTKAGNEPKEYNGVKGQRLRTAKFRGQVSQGLILPAIGNFPEGTDVSEVLGIQKWEAPVPAVLAGNAKGLFPSLIPKTDQERIQNLEIKDLVNHRWNVTEKLHGTSCTFYLSADGEFEVCSRNLSLKPDFNNAYWKYAIQNDIEGMMRRNALLGIAIQGELIGEGINGNQYSAKLDFYVFDIFNANTQKYILPSQLESACSRLGLKHVPIIRKEMLINEGWTHEEALRFAEGKSELNASEREGLVFKSETVHHLSFKIVSNKWLYNNDKS